jgi:hypothetical protein
LLSGLSRRFVRESSNLEISVDCVVEGGTRDNDNLVPRELVDAIRFLWKETFEEEAKVEELRGLSYDGMISGRRGVDLQA